MAQLRPNRLLVRVGPNSDLLPVNISNDHVASVALPLIHLLRRLGWVLARLVSERRCPVSSGSAAAFVQAVDASLRAL